MGRMTLKEEDGDDENDNDKKDLLMFENELMGSGSYQLEGNNKMVIKKESPLYSYDAFFGIDGQEGMQGICKAAEK